eukprot:GHVL01042049.1.p2 GENE.GHVL01042049.1~~GHVL01042049.1.p2  ORF type:complete len:117 (-),score=9.35 GHVL01042049.1:83-433(-)
MRLCQARCRIGLKDRITVEDVQDVIEIFQETAICNRPKKQEQFKPSKKSRRSGSTSSCLGEFLRAVRMQNSKNVHLSTLLQIAKQLGADHPYAVIDTANEAGYLLKNSGSTYSIVV